MSPRTRLLVVEGDFLQWPAWRERCGRWGYDLELAATPEEVLLQEPPRSCSLALMDLSPEGGNGPDWIARLRDQAALPVVAMTARGDVNTAVAALRAGAREVLERPLEESQAQQVVRDILGQPPYSPLPANAWAGQPCPFEELEQTKARFRQVVSHTLGTPVHLVKNAVELLQGGAQGEEARELLEILSRAAGHMDRVLMRLGAVGFIPGEVRLHLSHLTVEEVLRQLEENHGADAQCKQQQFTLQEEGKLFLRGDRVKLVQALGELVRNAIQFTPVCGWIRVEARSLGQGNMLITVCDNGPGIPLVDQAHIFRQFYEGQDPLRRGSPLTAEGGEGLGLGLAFAQSIIKAHGGRIKVDGAPGATGNGALFSVTLPRVAS